MSMFLGLEESQDRLDLTPARRFIQWDKRVGRPHVTVIFRDFVFKDQMVTKRVPRELADYPMILVQIVPVMGEDDIGRHSLLQRLEVFFDLPANVREEPVSEVFDENFLPGRSREEDVGAFLGLAPPLFASAEHNPGDIDRGCAIR
jgi:hypothetical protein